MKIFLNKVTNLIKNLSLRRQKHVSFKAYHILYENNSSYKPEDAANNNWNLEFLLAIFSSFIIPINPKQ